MLGWIFLIAVIHAVICVLLIILSAMRLVKMRPSAWLFMILVPIFGPISMLCLDLHKRISKGVTDVNVSRFRVEAEIYRSLGIRPEDGGEVVALEEAMIMNSSNTRRSLMMDLVKENVVPLEEALTISKTEIRRKLMMEVLTNDTAAFYSLLEQARLNDDVEVVHYATTAMSELNKQYDIMLQKCMKRVEDEPDSAEALGEYCSCMKQYLQLELVRGHMQKLRRAEYIDLLRRMADLEPTEQHFCDLAEQQLLNEDFPAADATLTEMEDRWLTSENVWLLRLEYHVRRGDGKAVQNMVHSAARQNIYFSARAREQMNFWMGKAETV